MQHHVLRIFLLAIAVAVICSEQVFGQFTDDSGEKHEAVLKRRVPPRSKTFEDVTVLLPRGELDEISKYGSAGNWGKMRELLVKTPAMESPEKDAYRYYGIALASEALAYANDDRRMAAQFLKNAELYYSVAIRQNPGEAYFLEGEERVITASEWYVITPVVNINAKSPTRRPTDNSIPGTKASVPVPKTGRGVGLPMSNNNVIDLVKSGLNEANLVWLIKDQQQTSFDLSIDGIRYLLDNKVTNAVITAMRERQSPAPQPTPRPLRKRP